MNLDTFLCNSASTTFGHCVQINFIAVHYAQQLSSSTEYKCNTKLCAFQLNAISWNPAECFSSIINTIQWNRMKWKRVYHIREFQHFSGIECNGLQLQCTCTTFECISCGIAYNAQCRTFQNIADNSRAWQRAVVAGRRSISPVREPAHWDTRCPCCYPLRTIPHNTTQYFYV